MDLFLVDAWRLLHPSERDYTYYSPAHKSYSRIDYIFLSQTLLDLNPTSKIGLKLWPDHAPMHVTLGRLPQRICRSAWRLNDNLLTDTVCTAAVSTAITDFVQSHTRDETSTMNTWETLKCVLGGIFIQRGSRLKRARTEVITRLFTLIASLDSMHKLTLEPKTLVELSNALHNLLNLFMERSLTAQNKGCHIQYSQVNKCGKHLARVIHPRQHRQNISHIISHYLPNQCKKCTRTQRLSPNTRITTPLFTIFPHPRHRVPHPSLTLQTYNTTFRTWPCPGSPHLKLTA